MTAHARPFYKQARYWPFCLIAVVCLLPIISSPVALTLGLTLASLGLVPKQLDLGAITKKLLAYSIVGLGFGIQLESAINASLANLPLIVGSIIATLLLGFLLTRLLNFDSKTGHLIAAAVPLQRSPLRYTLNPIKPPSR